MPTVADLMSSRQSYHLRDSANPAAAVLRRGCAANYRCRIVAKIGYPTAVRSPVPFGAEEGTQGAPRAAVAAPATVDSEPISPSCHWFHREGREPAPTC